ncbi:uncharacterized protein LOC128093655 [Culex pipiens pallens]|uniref:uncharacterized protein LOC128093655 n=1 Tax=Culex pipiens pallens TaxID=42434 RepID=UPI0022AB20DA|nr:uncharacterized protein LOC128093655 [Culex pipiens pallens]
MAAAKQRLSDCLVRRQGIETMRNQVEKFIAKFNAETDTCQIPVRLESLDRAYREFLEVQAELERTDKSEYLETHLTERADFETRYCEAKGFLLSKRTEEQNLTAMNSTMNTSQPTHPVSFHLRLPKIDLPKFDGDFSRWLSFRDAFTSMVHSNPDIPTVAKLQYLLNSLVDKAALQFENVEIEADKYAPTWDELLKRYDNKRFLKRKLFHALYDLPSLKRESASDLRTLVDDFHRHVKALEKLKEPVAHWDTPLVSILCYKLDSRSLRAWEEHTSKDEVVTYAMLTDFLYQRLRMLESVRETSEQQQPSKVAGTNPHPFQKKPFKVVSNAVASRTYSNNPQCLACSESHRLFECPVFARKSIQQRQDLVYQKRLCWNCFRSGHQSRNCLSRFTCQVCHEKHHTLLHRDAPPKMSSTQAAPKKPSQQPIQSTSTSVDPAPSTSNPESQVSLSVQSHRSTVLLETVALEVLGQNGKKYPARALLDSASMCNFITKKLANTLNLRRKKVDIDVAGIGESTKQIKCQLTATIQSKYTPYAAKLEFLILKRPTINLPTIPVDVSQWKLPEVSLADPKFNVPSDIDMVIGGESYHELHTGSKQTLDEGLPLMIETVFGWTVSGKVCIPSPSIPRVCHLTTVDRSLEQALQKFWELEAVEPCSVLTTEETHCEEIYSATTTRDSSGRYIVRLPLTRDPLVTLGASRTIAERRFLSLEKRLERDPTTREAYCKFMDEYERLNHMHKVDDPVDDSIPHCYLPHHPVFKASSTTTKVRVVFDASCKTASGFSVNDLQLVGPVVQEDLLSIVMRFRTYPIALVADCEKMYRQVLLHPEDRPYQRILWRPTPTQPLATYELNTVTYGFASSPFLATRTLLEIAKDEAKNYPEAVEAVKQDFYVDDFLSGADDLPSATRIRKQVSAMLLAAGFPLKKWASNVPEALADVPEEDLAIVPLRDLKDDQSVSVLGLVWDPVSDTLRFKVELPLPAAVLTKRIVMSYIAKIFDPAGFSGPVIVVSKLYMQGLWTLRTKEKHRYEWDRPLPSQLQAEWKAYHSTLEELSKVRIPRCVYLPTAMSVELHFYSDASEKAYGANCYVRCETVKGIQVRLLASRSKVAPLSKLQSIADLELCGAELSVKLYKKVVKAIKKPVEVFFHTDSMIVLQWLQSPPARWKTFVANRVARIQAETDVRRWRHVPGICNPADVLSRGLSPIELVNCLLWWFGPEHLSKSREHWPRSVIPDVDPGTLPGARSKAAVMLITAADPKFSDELFSRFSEYFHLRRAVAYWRRYFRILKAVSKKEKPERPEILTAAELRDAEIALCRVAQRDMFAEDAADLVSKERVSPSSPLKWLNPILHGDGLIRVGGRLSNAAVPDEVKHPIVLLAKHPLSILLAKSYHVDLLHAGPQLMLATIRQKFWIIGGRNLVRQTYHLCKECFQNKPTLVKQSIADLPTSRVTPTRPFAVSGVDYCGPFYIKSPIRNRAPTKAYVAIFVCFATRAVHIELVSDLSTQAFLSALRRFVARRGRPKEIHSDNGTAFKGASNELRKVYSMLKTDQESRKSILDYSAANEITWHFIPPRAPHFGGLWEAAVKSAKHHLLREIGNTNVSYEDMSTLLTQIEMCLNSRPLVPIPSDPSDLEVLTPGHFLVGTNLQAVEELNLADVPDNRLSHWELTQKRFQRIWSRWYPEYLQQLQSRAVKGCKNPVTIVPGRVVLIKDDNLPPTQWPLGRITHVHPGKDGVVRVVTLKTASSEAVVRPVAKIALLPVPAESEQQLNPACSN